MAHYFGIDGCRGGWIGVGLSRSEPWIVSTFANIDELWSALRGAKLFLIDIPIGLCDGEVKSRACDTAARRLLGSPRASSVFTPPARPALDFDDRGTASERNHILTGCRIGVQSWGISGKIKQVDQFLRSHPEARKKFREAHPELLFWALNGRKAMSRRKKGQAGFEERLGVLCRHFPPSKEIVKDALNKFKRSVVSKDDIPDALVSAVTALLGDGGLSSIPVEPQFDRCGLPMEMVYHIPE